MMDESEPQNAVIGFGTRLKSAREALRLSEKEVAARLHLTPLIIDLLEKEDFKNAPPAMFTRGYMRSYARMLNFNDQEINIALEQAGMGIQPVTAPNPLLHTAKIENNERYFPWATYLVIAIMAILAGIWWSSHSNAPAPLNNAAQQPQQQTPSEDLTVSQQQSQTQAATAEPQPPTVVAPAQITSTPPSPPPPPANNVVVTEPATPYMAQPAPEPAATTPSVQPVVPPLRAGIPATTMPSINPTDAPAIQAVQTDNNKPATRHKRRHEVSGVEMAIPEPGLESGG